MPNIVTTIFTQKHIGDIEIAKKFLSILDNVELTPEKIGTYEPLKEFYTYDRAVEIWSIEEPGCYEDGIGMVGKAGSIIGKIKEPNFRFDMQWWKHPRKESINCIRFYMSEKTFNKQKDVLLGLFRETIVLFDAFYGYISHETPLNRQHVTGTIETRMPGVFWCNFFSNKYVDFFGKERLLSFTWYQVDYVGTLGILCFLTEHPHKELLMSDEIEKKAQIHLGIDSFGDSSEYISNPKKIQYKNVPSLK